MTHTVINLTPEELAHLVGDCTYEQAKTMLAAPSLLEALEQVARLDQWRHSPEWLDNPSCRVDLNAAITNACNAIEIAK